MNRMRTRHHAIAGRRQRRPARRLLRGGARRWRSPCQGMPRRRSGSRWDRRASSSAPWRSIPRRPGRMYVGTNSAGVYRSDDGGVTLAGEEHRHRQPEHSALSPSIRRFPDTLYAGASGRRLVQDRERRGFVGAAERRPPAVRCVARSWSIRSTPDTVYAGLNGGGVWKSGDGGRRGRRPTPASTAAPGTSGRW